MSTRREFFNIGGMVAVKQTTAVLKTISIMIFDALCIVAAGGLALLVRFDFSFAGIEETYLNSWYRFLPLQIAITLAIFYWRKMYHFIWRSVSARDVGDMLVTVTAAYLVSSFICILAGDVQPRSVLLIELILQMFFLVGGRCILRFYQAASYAIQQHSGNYTDRIMLIGAGEAGRMLAHEVMVNRQSRAKICCIIDDDVEKWGRKLEGVPVVGGRAEITDAAAKYHITQIILAIPTASAQEKKKILELCQETGCRVRIVQGIYQLVRGEVSLANVKDVQIEDLLGCEPVQLDTEAVDGFIRDETVLVTGGGGSIGSELCRQIAHYHPRKLIIVDIYENNAYDIQQELRREGGIDLSVEIASVRDKQRVYEIFKQYRPNIVFHAAAHKHVPLMEACPAEAVKNNIFGTYHVVRAAEKFGVKKFVMISTDKAVNPTNFMGATKRFCEMILQSRPEGVTEFCAVRFGNVLGSNGSVVPLFKKQIEEGGPVTITDKRIIRYFMTIPEAAQLVLEAGAIAQKNQIFVLDMGKPVKILTLAENLIRLSGLEPYRDIEIREIGLRPGEKRYEELLMKSNTLRKTANKKIFVEQQEMISASDMMDKLETLDRAVTACLPDKELIGLLRGMIPTYHDPNEVNERAEVVLHEDANLVL